RTASRPSASASAAAPPPRPLPPEPDRASWRKTRRACTFQPAQPLERRAVAAAVEEERWRTHEPPSKRDRPAGERAGLRMGGGAAMRYVAGAVSGGHLNAP